MPELGLISFGVIKFWSKDTDAMEKNSRILKRSNISHLSQARVDSEDPMMTRYYVVLATLFFVLLTALPQGNCAPKGHMSVLGIEGESISASCLGCIDILTVTESQVKGERSVVVTKLIDRSSIEWRILSAMGDTLPEITIQFYTGDEINFKFWEMKLVDVAVKSVIMKALTGEGKPEEKIELVPSRIIWTYVPQKADGAMGTEISDSFDYKTHKMK